MLRPLLPVREVPSRGFCAGTRSRISAAWQRRLRVCYRLLTCRDRISALPLCEHTAAALLVERCDMATGDHRPDLDFSAVQVNGQGFRVRTYTTICVTTATTNTTTSHTTAIAITEYVSVVYMFVCMETKAFRARGAWCVPLLSKLCADGDLDGDR